MPRIHIAFPKLPPALDGIGDHTARLAVALAEHADVTVLTADTDADALPGVRVRPVLQWKNRRIDPAGVAEAVRDDRPDALLLQYNPVSWGYRGLNLAMGSALSAARRAHPDLMTSIMVHETSVPMHSVKSAILGAAQWPQLCALARTADAVFISTEAWRTGLGRCAGGAPIVHLPVGSNITHAGYSREAARAALGISPETLVAGVFGTARASRLVPLIRAAVEKLCEHNRETVVLYVGPDGDAIKGALSGLPVRDLGPLPDAEVSRALSAFDLHLAPFSRGVTTRRGSFIAGLQHGVPTVSTYGPDTDPILSAAVDDAFVLTHEDDAEGFAAQAVSLAADLPRRQAFAERSRRLYLEVFDWAPAASRVLHTLASLRAPALRS